MTDVQADSQAHQDYLQSRILSAHPVEIVHMLYQVAIDNLNAAIACLKTANHFERSRVVSKAQEAVSELMYAVNPQPSPVLGRNLAELYDYVQREIIAGHTRRSEQAFRNALRVLTTLSEGWSGVRTQVLADAHRAIEEQSEPVREPETNRYYGEFSRAQQSGRDWSC
jgi:flagellar biosynthetic protein FliS